MSEPTQTIEGWYALHDFRTFDWPAWKGLPVETRADVVREFLEFSAEYRRQAEGGSGSYGVYSIPGHKADLLFLYFQPEFPDLAECKARFQKTRLADFTRSPYSYTSVVELSAYLSRPGSDPDPRVEARLKPAQDKGRYVCFYPMNKRRTHEDNWYMMDKDARTQLMVSHGMIGRAYAGKVTQIITGSVGLDDWEWGVTLFSDDPLQFKKLVYEMRFDEVSARFGDFGPFYPGTALTDGELAQWLSV